MNTCNSASVLHCYQSFYHIIVRAAFGQKIFTKRFINYNSKKMMLFFRLRSYLPGHQVISNFDSIFTSCTILSPGHPFFLVLVWLYSNNHLNRYQAYRIVSFLIFIGNNSTWLGYYNITQMANIFTGFLCRISMSKYRSWVL